MSHVYGLKSHHFLPVDYLPTGTGLHGYTASHLTLELQAHYIITQYGDLINQTSVESQFPSYPVIATLGCTYGVSISQLGEFNRH